WSDLPHPIHRQKLLVGVYAPKLPPRDYFSGLPMAVVRVRSVVVRPVNRWRRIVVRIRRWRVVIRWRRRYVPITTITTIAVVRITEPDARHANRHREGISRRRRCRQCGTTEKQQRGSHERGNATNHLYTSCSNVANGDTIHNVG